MSRGRQETKYDRGDNAIRNIGIELHAIIYLNKIIVRIHHGVIQEYP